MSHPGWLPTAGALGQIPSRGCLWATVHGVSEGHQGDEQETPPGIARNRNVLKGHKIGGSGEILEVGEILAEFIKQDQMLSKHPPEVQPSVPDQATDSGPQLPQL